MDDLTTFKGRKEYGDKAENEFYKYCDTNNIEYIPIVSREEWEKVENVWDEEKRKLQKRDLEEGDALLVEMNENVDIKHHTITFRSLDNFKHTYYIVYHHFLHKAMVLKSMDVKKLDRNDCDILESGDKGFKYDKLEKAPRLTLDEFFGIKTESIKTNTTYEKHPLSIEKATDKVRLFFSNGTSYVAAYKIEYLSNYMRSVKRKDPTFIGYSINDGEIIRM